MEHGRSRADPSRVRHGETGSEAGHVVNLYSDSLYIYKNLRQLARKMDNFLGMGDLQVKLISIILKGARESTFEKNTVG